MNQFTASLWGDEAFSTVLAMRSPMDIIRIVARDTSPPLHPLILHYWMKIFGTSEIAIRSLSFTFYLLTILVIFLIAKSLWNKKTGLLAALLAAVNPFFFIYAFEGRMYSLLLLTSTLSTYFFLTRRRWPHALATAAALYTHHFSLLVIGIQGLWAVGSIVASASRRHRLKRAASDLWPFAAALVIYSPWLPILYQQSKMVTGGFWLGTPSLKDLKNIYLSFLTGNKTGLFRNIALILTGIIIASRRWQFKKWLDWFMLSWYFLPIFLIWLFSQIAQSIFFDRYMLAMIPGALLLLASNRRRIISNLSIILLAVILAYIAQDYFIHPTRRPFRELASFVKQTSRPGDQLVNWNTQAHHLWEMKYYGIPAPIYAGGVTELPFFVGTAQMTEGDIIAKLPDSPRIGIAFSGDDNVDVPSYQKTEEKHFGDLTFQWWQKN